MPLSNACGQCYDGAKNMYGSVSNKMLSENPKAFFTRCFGHALNLALGDMVENARFLKDNSRNINEVIRSVLNFLLFFL